MTEKQNKADIESWEQDEHHFRKLKWSVRAVWDNEQKKDTHTRRAATHLMILKGKCQSQERKKGNEKKK